MASSHKARYCNGFPNLVEQYRGPVAFHSVYTFPFLPFHPRLVWSQKWSHPFHLPDRRRSEEHTSELQSRRDLVCRLLLEKKKRNALPSLASSKINLTYSSPHTP